MNVKKVEKVHFIFFFSFLRLVIWNDDKMMMFLILTILYNFHLEKNDQNLRLNYTKNVEKQSIAKLIIARLFGKLGNSIYRRSDDGQTVAARGQTSKGGLTLHVGPKGFRPCLSSYMMMHNNRRLLPDRGGIPKAAHLRHGGIAFPILTLNSAFFINFINCVVATGCVGRTERHHIKWCKLKFFKSMCFAFIFGCFSINDNVNELFIDA